MIFYTFFSYQKRISYEICYLTCHISVLLKIRNKIKISSLWHQRQENFLCKLRRCQFVSRANKSSTFYHDPNFHFYFKHLNVKMKLFKRQLIRKIAITIAWKTVLLSRKEESARLAGKNSHYHSAADKRRTSALFNCFSLILLIGFNNLLISEPHRRLHTFTVSWRIRDAIDELKLDPRADEKWLIRRFLRLLAC